MESLATTRLSSKGQVEAEIIEAPALPAPVSADPDDDKFFACASAAGVAAIVSGDKDLLDHDGWRGVRVLRPRQFAVELLADASSVGARYQAPVGRRQLAVLA